MYLRMYSEVYLGADLECTWEPSAKQARSVPSSASRTVLESILGSVLVNVP